MDEDEVLGYKVGELLAVEWSPEMAARFPNVSHAECRVNRRENRCYGLHCNRCGAPTDAQGGHNCPDRLPAAS